MAIGRAVRDTETDPFYDMLFNMLIAFVFCFVIALLSWRRGGRDTGLEVLYPRMSIFK